MKYVQQKSSLTAQLQTHFPGNYQLKKHGKSFYFAQLFLPQSHSKKICDLYQVCRLIDDLADKPLQDHQSAGKQLETIKQMIQQQSCDKQTQISKDCSVNTASLSTLITGVQSDLSHQQLPTTQALIEYCYEVAGTVGLMMCDLMQVHQPQARLHAIDLGIAMQLTNIARDVWVDANMGRIYIPIDMIGNLSAQKIVQDDRPTSVIMSSIKQLLLIADNFYRSGILGLKYVPRSHRMSIYIAASLYRSIGDAIRENNYFKPGLRNYVPLWKKMMIASQCIIRFHQNPEKLTPGNQPSHQDLFRELTCFSCFKESYEHL